jgi:hypothetical protein
MKPSTLAPAFLLAVLPLQFSAAAFLSEEETSGPARSEHQAQLSLSVRGTAEADLEDGGDLSTTRVKLGVDYATDRTIGEGSIRVGGFYEASDYDFDDGSLDVDIFGLRLDYSEQSGEEMGWFATVGANFASGEDADFDDGITGFGAGGVVLVLSEDLTIRLGAGGATSLEDDGFFFPVIAVDWAITDRLHLKTFDGVYLTYDLTEDKGTVLDASLRYERRDIRTDDDTDEALLETSFITSLGIRQRVTDAFFVRAFAGIEMERELELFQGSNSVGKEDVDDAAIVGLEGSFSF